jgi:ribosomal-protein-alanine N-acetyltransferase
VVSGHEAIEVGWAVAPDRWGEGIATELARASIELAFAEFDLDEVVSFTLTTNRASQRVMEKAGLGFERRIEHAGLPHVLYRLRAATR